MIILKTLSQVPKSVVSKNLPRIALIGCGAIAEEYYLPALTKHSSVLKNLILIDNNPVQLQRLTQKYNVKNVLFDYRDALEEVDAVIIAAPTPLHYPISMEFLSRGVNVLCEKPLAESAEKAKGMIEKAQRTRVTLAVNYFQRIIPSFIKVKQLVEEKTLGELLSIKYFVGEEFKWPTVSGFYFNSPVSSRGILRDRGAHVFDHICWWLGGKPRVISSQNDSFGGSEAVAYVKFEYGKGIGEVRLSWLVNFPCKFTATFERGIIEGDVYDYQNISLLTSTARKKRIYLASEEKTKKDIANKIVTNFINTVTKDEKPLISGSEVLDSIEFIDECYATATRFNMPWYEFRE